MNEVSNPLDAAAFERRRRLFTFLPLFVVPVLTLLFWGLGGGSGNAATVDRRTATLGAVNTQLPDPIVDRARNKREAYQRAEQERDRRAYALSRDPYAALLRDTSVEANSLPSPPGPRSSMSDWGKRFAARTGNLEAQLNSFTDRVGVTTAGTGSGGGGPRRKERSGRTSTSPASLDFAAEDGQVADIERAIAKLNAGGIGSGGTVSPTDGYAASFSPAGGLPPSPPPELIGGSGEVAMTAQDSLANQQLATLDRIMERATLLQYPELAEDQLRNRSQEDAKHVFPVAEAPSAAGDIKLFGASSPPPTTSPASVASVHPDSFPPASAAGTGATGRGRRIGFFTDDSDEQLGGGAGGGGGGDFTQLTVRAQVHNSVTVMDGSTLKLRLLEDVYVAGQRIPANTFVYGQCGLRGDRLTVAVSTITYRNNVYDVALSVYDLDGQPGLSVPGSVERQIAKREASASARSLGHAGGSDTGTNLASRLAAEGTQTIREIASRKLSVIKVELKAGHRTILRNS